MRHVATLFALLFVTPAASAGLSGYVTLSGADTLTSATTVMYDPDVRVCTSNCTYRMSGWHTINWSRTGEGVADETWSVTTGSYRGTISASASPGECYFAQNDVDVSLVSGSAAGVPLPTPMHLTGETYPSPSVCRPADPSPPREPITICDDGSYSGQCSPIVIDLGSSAYRLSGEDDPVLFDIDADGTVERITWPLRGGSVAFLALDRNANREIDNGAELFGDSTRLASGARAANGFEALEDLDSNADGRVDLHDHAWDALLLWSDVNHDGVSQEHELQRIETSAVRSLETRYRWIGRRDGAGNLYRYRGLAHFAEGSRAIYDVYFRRVP